MKEDIKVSRPVLRRMPRYLRYLGDLGEKSKDRISSKELGTLMGFTASQIRQDLSHFGGFGHQGYGYNVDVLHGEISTILGLDKKYKMVVIGAGNLGRAIVNYTYYYKSVFVVSGVFEIIPEVIGTKINDIEIYSYETLEEFVGEHKIDIGIICTTKSNAQAVADKLSGAGIKGIWNFAPLDVSAPENVMVENVHLSDSLHYLAYHVNRQISGE